MEKEGKRIPAKGNSMDQGGNMQYMYRLQHNSKVQKSDGLQTIPNPVSPGAPGVSCQIASRGVRLTARFQAVACLHLQTAYKMAAAVPDLTSHTGQGKRETLLPTATKEDTVSITFP